MLHPVPIMLIGVSLIPLGDTMGKILMEQYNASQSYVAWTRFLIGAILLLPFLQRRHLDFRVFLKWQIWLRSLVQLAAILCILTALKTEPIANVFGAFFVAPIVSYLISVWFLKEKTTLPRLILLMLGFCGVLLVVKPGFGMTTGMMFAVLSGVFYGLFLTANRWLSDLALPRTLLMTQLVIATTLLTPSALFHSAWPELTPTVILYTALSSIASLVGNLLLITAYKLAPATRLAPLVYFQLVAATALSFSVFGVIPDFISILGLTLLTASGFATLALRR
ncbi:MULTISPECIES: DMT family transporter [Halocynthiibacter]|uniref:DMT family transporter n=1 Tax=Halocynthiibacter halioticoli TaxID=2986804 RepID=A0AAE3IWL9_9RHOB|nr:MULTISPECIES: DMT family transporter [Halocynthiibacter]MCV6823567.1 DMT family transporter [Halocynthiibacter halioticoli]MCW4056568.1 DMT family transporter [Halocynthiibacter sp. SDUM655004]